MSAMLPQVAGQPGQKLTGGRCAAVLLLPWVFLAVFSFMFTTFFLPHFTSNIFSIGLGIFLLMVFGSFAVAAVTFSRDVVQGRYP